MASASRDTAAEAPAIASGGDELCGYGSIAAQVSCRCLEPAEESPFVLEVCAMDYVAHGLYVEGQHIASMV